MRWFPVPSAPHPRVPWRRLILALRLICIVALFLLGLATTSFLMEELSEMRLFKQLSECNCSREFNDPPQPNQVSMRVYTDLPLEGEYCGFICKNSDLFWCNLRRVPGLGDMRDLDFRVWRFLPLGDPTVDVFLVRDFDSVITTREAVAVKDWLELGYAIHVMRDHKQGHDLPILGGMWGARNDLLGEEVARHLRDEVIRKSDEYWHRYGTDQFILNDVLFYPMAKQIVAHDSYHCKRWSNFTLVRPFPSRRKDNVSDFVGNADLGRKEWEYLDECPEECRPSYGKDWEFC